jgi:LmbE family N-acetylglucosaminyl deacetylase
LIIDLIQIENPHIVYTHHKDDRHQDHEIVARMSDIACRRVPCIFTYKSPSTRGEFDPHLFHGGSEEEFERKMNLLKIYQSQLKRSGGVNLEMMLYEARATASLMS